MEGPRRLLSIALHRGLYVSALMWMPCTLFNRAEDTFAESGFCVQVRRIHLQGASLLAYH